MRPRKYLIAGLAAATALVLAACSGGGKSASSGPSDSGGKPDTSATLNVGLVLEPTDLNVRTTSGVALDQILIDNVYQGLVGLDPNGKIVDVLAKSHSISSDGLDYTFTLKSGVAFSDGTKLTAQDVAWSINQVRTNPKYVDNNQLTDVSSITAPDASTVDIKLAKPNAELLYDLAGRAGLVLEQGATNDLATSAIGTGPYKLQSWKQGDSITFTRNDAYWGPKAKVASVVWHYYTDTATAVNAAVSGDIQVLTPVDATLKSKLNSGFTLTSGESTDKYVLAFNSKRAPLNDLKVRQALREAIDPKAIIAAVGGDGVPMGGPIPKGDPGYQDLTSINAYNPSDAKKLLAEAGHPKLTLTLTVPNIYSTATNDVLVSEFAKVGVTLKVDSVEFTTWLSQVYTNKDYDLSLVDHSEAHDFGDTWATPGYYFNYSNPQVQSLYAEALATTSAADESAKLAQAAKLVSQDAPADWLYNWTPITAVGTGVMGFPTSGTNNRINLVNLEVTK
ncbi:ABC transporter substrate-binding protein [Gryllotalpicola reticulitermitis]|uniref:ABC transporter substrate-binding protein n=1 Tax=Gryllotalpicola reticulitermitis TaxID=1184153 RepID=A0ABV8QAB9_9MICO